MNVTCDKCQKRYAIADEKVRGKSVKIRCKQCQNLISVQGPSAQAVDTSGAAAGPSPWEEESTRAMPSLDMSAAWYAMVKGTQIGPLDLVALEQKVKAGELTLRTYLWKQGMADWKRASDVPEVSPVFAGVAVAPGAGARPPSKASAAVQRDVAVANEMPSPEITNRQAPAQGTNGNGNGNGHGHAEAAAETTDAAGHQFDDQATQAVIQSPINAASGGLGDLFNDAPATDPQPDAAASTGDTDASGPDATASDGASAAPADPFAALGEADPSLAPPPGEATKFFIAQAGVNKRNPPWKIALFVLGGVGLPVGLLFLLSTLHIVPLNVTRTDENGQEVQQSFFSAEGISGLKDILSGEEKRRQAAAAERKKRQQEEQAKRAQLAGNMGGSNAGTGTGTSATGTTDSPSNKDLFGGGKTPGLDDFYKENTGKGGDKIPKDRLAGSGTSKPEVVVSAKWSEAAQKTVSDKIKSFQACIETELRKNPNLKVGKVIVTANVGGSGTVTSASISPDKYSTSSWGECMKSAAKRIAFPALDDPGDTTAVEIPITVGVALGD